MKKISAVLCIAGTALALSACQSGEMGNVETAVPYTTSRTASHGDQAVTSAAPQSERVFRQVQTK